jgi:TetR/AcrR family transcriptional repressor of nem operon
VDSVGVNELMDAAGFTRGGFYNHFKSKDALVAAVIDKALRDGVAMLEPPPRGDPLTAQIEFYLSPPHRSDIAQGCPLSGFVGDVRRLDEASREGYARGLEFRLEHLAGLLAAEGADPAQARAGAITTFSQMVGGLLLARAVAQADPELSDEVLAQTRRHLLAARSRRAEPRRKAKGA